MSNEDSPVPGSELREKIVGLMRSNAQAIPRPISSNEVQKLKDAANRLDRILQTTANTEVQALKSAVAKLDQMLTDIGKGKDITIHLKRRPSATT